MAAAKARGVKLGAAGLVNLKPNIEARRAAADAFATRMSGVVTGFQARGLSQRAIVAELNSVGIAAPSDGQWGLAQVQRLLARAAANSGRET